MERARFEIAQGRLGPGRDRSIACGRRRRGAGARIYVPRLDVARGLRQADFRTVDLARADRAGAMHDRPGRGCSPEGRLHDGHGRQQGRARGDGDDEGGRTEYGRGQIIDWADQAHGAAGVSADFRWLTCTRTSARSVADGPDEVHRAAIAKIELRKHDDRRNFRSGGYRRNADRPRKLKPASTEHGRIAAGPRCACHRHARRRSGKRSVRQSSVRAANPCVRTCRAVPVLTLHSM